MHYVLDCKIEQINYRGRQNTKIPYGNFWRQWSERNLRELCAVLYKLFWIHDRKRDCSGIPSSMVVVERSSNALQATTKVVQSARNLPAGAESELSNEMSEYSLTLLKSFEWSLVSNSLRRRLVKMFLSLAAEKVSSLRVIVEKLADKNGADETPSSQDGDEGIVVTTKNFNAFFSPAIQTVVNLWKGWSVKAKKCPNPATDEELWDEATNIVSLFSTLILCTRGNDSLATKTEVRPVDVVQN